MTPDADDSELQAWIRLALEPDLKAAQLHQLLSLFGMPQTICAASVGSLARYLDPALAASLTRPPDAARQAVIDHTLEWLAGAGRRLLTMPDPEYPKVLLELPDPPAILFAQGNLTLLQHPRIAIVGSRSATRGGMANARDFAHFLAQKGWCIVSGLASGIDAAAHEGALQAGDRGGGTLAVLGTGIDRTYPPANHDLAVRIASEGLLLSEFPLGATARPFHFPRRNRLVAALSQGVLVVEAASRSGSLITARLAGNLGREVFAIPGSIHSPQSHGCHALIRQGAKLVESGQDILEELGQGTLPGMRGNPAADTPDPAPVAETPETAASRTLLEALGHEPATLDALLARTGWTTPELLHQLAVLEFNGRLAREADGRYARLR